MFYLRVHIQCQAPLIRKYQVDDALQYGSQEGVDAKHQRTELPGERRSDLEAVERRLYQTVTSQSSLVYRLLGNIHHNIKKRS